VAFSFLGSYANNYANNPVVGCSRNVFGPFTAGLIFDVWNTILRGPQNNPL